MQADHIIPANIKAYLTNLKTNERAEVTDDVMNWDELDIKISRDGMSGTFVEVQTEVQFCRDARQMVKSAWAVDFLDAKMQFELYELGKGTSQPYGLIHSQRLNFGTYTETKDSVTIEGSSTSFKDLVRSVGSTKYDIQRSELANEKIWAYEHPIMVCGADWIIPSGEFTLLAPENNFAIVGQTFSMSLKGDPSMALGGMEYDIKSQQLATGKNGTDSSGVAIAIPESYFFGNFDSVDGTVYISGKFTVSFVGGGVNGISDFSSLACRLVTISADGIIADAILRGVNEWPFVTENTIIGTSVDVDFGNDTPVDIDLSAGMKLALIIDGVQSPTSLAGSSQEYQMEVSNFDHISVNYTDKSTTGEVEASTRIDDPLVGRVIKNIVYPLDFGQALLNKMADGDADKQYALQIDNDPFGQFDFNEDATGVRLALIAGEAIRGYDDYKFHASYNDFYEFMQFIGYEMFVDETNKILQFSSRTRAFDISRQIIDLSESEVKDVTVSADAERAFSAVSIGYEKPDIENTNGKYAIMGMFEYTTNYDNNNTEATKIEITCPYKADPVEIEVLSWERANKDKDTRNDNDIFILALAYGGIATDGTTEYLVSDMSTVYSVSDSDLPPVAQGLIQFGNTKLLPSAMLVRNADRIMDVTRELKFAGTDAYAKALLADPDGGAISHTDPYTPEIQPETSLYAPFVYEVEVGSRISLTDAVSNAGPDKWNGAVSFAWGGEKLRGFINDVGKNLVRDKNQTWTLQGYAAARDTRNTLTYSLPGATPSIVSKDYPVGATVTLETLAALGMTLPYSLSFKGWFRNGAQVSSVIMSTDISVEGQTTGIFATVTYQLLGATPQTITKQYPMGDTVYPGTPQELGFTVPSDYVFAGWKLSSTGAVASSFTAFNRTIYVTPDVVIDSTGTVTFRGSVKSSITGEYLSGATVDIAFNNGSTMEVHTDAIGSFSFDWNGTKSSYDNIGYVDLSISMSGFQTYTERRTLPEFSVAIADDIVFEGRVLQSNGQLVTFRANFVDGDGVAIVGVNASASIDGASYGGTSSQGGLFTFSAYLTQSQYEGINTIQVYGSKDGYLNGTNGLTGGLPAWGGSPGQTVDLTSLMGNVVMAKIIPNGVSRIDRYDLSGNLLNNYSPNYTGGVPLVVNGTREQWYIRGVGLSTSNVQLTLTISGFTTVGAIDGTFTKTLSEWAQSDSIAPGVKLNIASSSPTSIRIYVISNGLWVSFGTENVSGASGAQYVPFIRVIE